MTPGSAFVAGNQNAARGYHEAFVCAKHKALMETGTPWDMEGRNVLMGQDLAPILENWSVRPCVGSAGCTLTLEIAGQIKPVEVFLMPSEARTLSTYIGAANGGFGGA
ncbi:hypothetical protein AAIH32_09005 [Pseudarthrobacter oxydans]|uniref:hypothetical protein n=1 Tax=Pseudarthrobacter oxydans TaxID=1671 RepID=UPI003D2C99FD